MPGPARVRPRGDEGGERRSVRPVIHQPAFQLQREMPLGPAHQDRFQQLAERLVGQLPGDPHAGDLLVVLDDPQLFDGPPQIGEVQPRRGGADGPVAGHGQMVFLDGQRLGAVRRRQIGGGHGGVAVRPGQQEQPQILRMRPRPGPHGDASGATRTSWTGPRSSVAPAGASPHR